MQTHAHSPPFPIRRTAREWTLRFLYQFDLRGEPFADTVLQDFLTLLPEEQPDAGPKEQEKITRFVESAVRGVIDHLPVLDQLIASHAHNWRLERMPVVDRNILRIAVYELRFCPDIPPVVAINEAIDIAKVFGDEDSGKFVNGILDQIHKESPPPASPAEATTENVPKE